MCSIAPNRYKLELAIWQTRQTADERVSCFGFLNHESNRKLHNPRIYYSAEAKTSAYIILWLHLPDRFHSSDDSICLIESPTCSMLAGRAIAVARIEHASLHHDERVHGFVFRSRDQVLWNCDLFDGGDERSYEPICTRPTILLQLQCWPTSSAENSNKSDFMFDHFSRRNQQYCVDDQTCILAMAASNAFHFFHLPQSNCRFSTAAMYRLPLCGECARNSNQQSHAAHSYCAFYGYALCRLLLHCARQPTRSLQTTNMQLKMYSSLCEWVQYANGASSTFVKIIHAMYPMKSAVCALCARAHHNFPLFSFHFVLL